MPPNPIPDNDHVARHVRSGLLLREGTRVTCFPQAFLLRPATATRQAEQYLSASWLEYFAGSRSEQLLQALVELRGYLTVKPRDGLSVVNAGRLKSLSQERGYRVRVLHEPRRDAPSYAAIRGIPRDDEQLLGLIEAEAVVETVEVSSLR